MATIPGTTVLNFTNSIIPGTGVLNFTNKNMNPTQPKSTIVSKRDPPKPANPKPLAPIIQLPLYPIRSHQHTRPCSRCKTLVPTTQQYKLCTACREKGMINSANYSKRAREQEEMMSRFPMIGEGAKRVGKKFKGEAVDAKGKGKDVGMSYAESENHPSIHPPPDPPTEYQTITLLLSALSTHYFRSRSSTSHSNSFTATYSILSTANPPITLDKRVEMVSVEVWRTLWCVGLGQFGVFDRLNPIAKSTTTRSSSQTFACLCLPNLSNPSASTTTTTSTSPNPKRPKTKTKTKPKNIGTGPRPATGLKMKLLVGKGNRYGMDMGMGCGNTITVRVENDSSHPLGVGGQKVFVTVGR